MIAYNQPVSYLTLKSPGTIRFDLQKATGITHGIYKDLLFGSLECNTLTVTWSSLCSMHSQILFFHLQLWVSSFLEEARYSLSFSWFPDSRGHSSPPNPPVFPQPGAQSTSYPKSHYNGEHGHLVIWDPQILYLHRSHCWPTRLRLGDQK